MAPGHIKTSGAAACLHPAFQRNPLHLGLPLLILPRHCVLLLFSCLFAFSLGIIAFFSSSPASSSSPTFSCQPVRQSTMVFKTTIRKYTIFLVQPEHLPKILYPHLIFLWDLYLGVDIVTRECDPEFRRSLVEKLQALDGVSHDEYDFSVCIGGN